IGLDLGGGLGLNLHPAGPGEAHLRQPSMVSLVQQREAADSQWPPDVADDHHIQPPVIQPGVGRQPHATAGIAAVGHHDGPDAEALGRPVVQAAAEVAARSGGQGSETGPRRSRPTQQSVHHLVDGAIAAHRDHGLPVGGGRGLGGGAAPGGPDDVHVHPGGSTGGGAAGPEPARPAIARDRVYDDERLRTRRAVSTSRLIWCWSAVTEANRRSPRSRWTKNTVSSLPYRSPW